MHLHLLDLPLGICVIYKVKHEQLNMSTRMLAKIIQKRKENKRLIQGVFFHWASPKKN